PGVLPTVQLPAEAWPVASVGAEATATLPPPPATAKVTLAPTIGFPLPSWSRTLGATATAPATVAVWASPAAFVRVSVPTVGWTSNVAFPLTPPTRAMILAFPLPTAVTLPLASTAATDAWLLLHSIRRAAASSRLPDESRRTASKEVTEPVTAPDTSGGLTSIAATGRRASTPWMPNPFIGAATATPADVGPDPISSTHSPPPRRWIETRLPATASPASAEFTAIDRAAGTAKARAE